LLSFWGLSEETRDLLLKGKEDSDLPSDWAPLTPQVKENEHRMVVFIIRRRIQISSFGAMAMLES